MLKGSLIATKEPACHPLPLLCILELGLRYLIRRPRTRPLAVRGCALLHCPAKRKIQEHLGTPAMGPGRMLARRKALRASGHAGA